MTYFPPNANGSATSANSSPVVIASDQAAVATKAAASAFADGWDVNAGATADAVVAAGASGSISAKLRRLTTDLSAMSAKLPAALGQTTMAASTSVTIASNQTAVATSSTNKLKGYTAASASVLTTEVNALANNANSAASSAVDNTSNLDRFMDLELVLSTQGSARSAGATVQVFMTRSVDGTNYDDVNETTASLVAVFALDAATTARRLSVGNIRVGPGKWKLFARNQTGQAFGATTNILNHRFYSEQSV